MTSWPQCVAQWGDAPQGGHLAHALRGFFANGGIVCYVLRLQDDIDTLAALRAGLERISALDDIDLVCAPDIMRGGTDGSPLPLESISLLQQELLDHCQRLGDRFAILDGIAGADIAMVEKHREKVQSTFAALYFPWVAIDGAPTYAPPCGHVAGIYARGDRAQGVHKAPANEEVEGVLDLRVNLTNAQQGRLNDLGVNCLRVFPGRGIRVWGARTTSASAPWTYVATRRLFTTVSRWLDRYMPEVAFEPNDIRLWVRIMRELSAFLEDLFRRGALQGQRPEQAFYVKCDGETNPPQIIDAGMVVTEVGLAPTVPGEFIVLRVSHGPSGVTTTDFA
jgi:phage tail sheath protein FI